VEGCEACPAGHRVGSITRASSIPRPQHNVGGTSRARRERHHPHARLPSGAKNGAGGNVNLRFAPKDVLPAAHPSIMWAKARALAEGGRACLIDLWT